MKYIHTDRRGFLKLMLALPAILSVELEAGVILADDVVIPVSAEGSLKKLIYCLGPWKQGEKEKAEDFADRFIRHAAAPYLEKSKDHVNSLAAHFSSSAKAVESIDLQDLSEQEKDLLMDLLQHLYTLVEVRFEVSNEPLWGECQNDRMLYTKPPE